MIWFISVYLQLSFMAPFFLLMTRMKKHGNKISIIFLVAFGLIRYMHALNELVETILLSTNAG